MNNVGIQGLVANNIDYKGIVTLSQKIGGKKVKLAKIHNAGGRALFDFLADCLMGDFDSAKINRPSKITLLYRDSDNNLTKADNTPFIYITTKPERVLTNLDEGVVRYSFTISQDIFFGTTFNAIGLYTDSETNIENYAAYCQIDSADLGDISVSSVLLLDWELHISN